MQPPLTLASLTSFDWFLIAILVVSTLIALRRGIIKVLFSLGGLIVGILAASWYYLALAQRLHAFVSSFAAAEVISFLAILIAITILFSLAARLVRKTVSMVGLGFLDRLFGAVFGLVRGLLFGVAIMMAVAAFTPESTWLRESRLAPYFLTGAHAVSFVVPPRFARQIGDGANRLLEKTPQFFRPHTSGQSM